MIWRADRYRYRAYVTLKEYDEDVMDEVQCIAISKALCDTLHGGSGLQQIYAGSL